MRWYLPAVILRIQLWNALTAEAVTASTAEIFQRTATPVIDIIVHLLVLIMNFLLFLFNVLIIVLIYLLLYCINLFYSSGVSFTLHDHEI